MPKHRFRESIMSFLGNHVDPEKDEQLKGSKIEIDDKVTQILKLVKNEEIGSKKESLVQLIEDFNKHYQSLYAQYDHLTGELKKKVHGKREKDASSSSSSDSDTDYSSKDGGSKNGQLESKFQKIADSIKQELEAANLEIANLKGKLAATSEEKDALSSNYLASLSKLQEAEENIKNLKLESERSKSEKSQLLVENEELKLKLSELSHEVQQAQGKVEQLVTELNQSKEEQSERERELMTLKELHEVHGNQSSAQIKELEAHVKSLELELESLQATNIAMALQIENKASEAEQLNEQNRGLQSKISELEMMSKKREEELLILTKKFEDDQKESLSRVENLTVQINNLLTDMESLHTEKAHLEERIAFKTDEASTQVKSLMDQVNILQQEVESLHSQEAELELQLEREKQESSESLNDMENQKSELERQINNHQRMLKEQEDAFNKLSEEYKQLETSFQDCKALIEVAERKMQEMAGEHEKSVQLKDQMVADLEEIIEGLKRELEMKVDELSSFVDNVRTIEVKLRLSNQKLRVTEQLLTEKEESFRKAEAKFLEEQRMLEERVTTLSGIIAANNEAYRRMISGISENVNNNLIGFEAVIQKFEERYNKYDHCIKETSKELKIAKHWVVETKKEKKQLMNEMTNLIEQLKDQKEQESMLQDKVEKLQIKANKEELEKENMLKCVKQLENKVEFLERSMKEKDQGILGLGEEKKEAIRQLCIWIDYHRSRCDDLKEILSKGVRVQRAT